MTIEGTVTSQQGLLDADGVRVTVQDQTAAILVRLPAETSTDVGKRLRITGVVGTYYGAPQLAAASATADGNGDAKPLAVSSAPLGLALEWRLVTVTGQVESVRRDGDAWRAELAMDGGGTPIVGLARSQIAADAVAAGRSATITGIVKRAYPTASDQRLAVVPRSAADIRLGDSAAQPTDGPAATQSAGQTGRPRPHGSSASDSPGRSPAAPGRPTPPVAGGSTRPTADTVPLGDLAGADGETVTVGGTVVAIDGLRLTIDDGSASAVVRLVGDATSLAAVIGIGDLINATGRVERNAAGGLEVAVEDPAAISRLLQVAAASDAPDTASRTSGAQKNLPGSPAGDGGPSPGGRTVAVALGALGLLALVAAVVAVRGNRERLIGRMRDLAARARARVSALRSG